MPSSDLNVKGAGQLVAALRLHGLHLCVVESVEGQVLDFAVILVSVGKKKHERHVTKQENDHETKKASSGGKTNKKTSNS